MLNKTFDRFSGTNFNGEAFTASDSFAFSKASDGDYVKLVMNVSGHSYTYFSNYDSKFNEVHFASETAYTDVDYSSYNSLTVKLFNNYVQVTVANMNASLMTAVPLSDDNVTLKAVGYTVMNPTGDVKKNTAKVGESILLTLNVSTTDKVTYSFAATTGAEYVTLSDVKDEYGDKVDDQKTVTVKEGSEGKDVVIKASVTNGTITIDRLFSFTVESATQPDTPAVTTLDSAMLGTWVGEDDYSSELKVVITSASDIKVIDSVDMGDSTAEFKATNIQLVSTTEVKFTLSGTTGGDNFKNGMKADVELNGEQLYVEIGDYFNQNFDKE